MIDNAVKFSPHGARITVTVRPSDAGAEGGDGVDIVVRDNGPGVDTEELALLTDRFWRSPQNRSTPGSGLGLAIATDLLNSVGGRIRVDAPEDGGLAVTLRLTRGNAS